jgi:hypothetical protein
MEESFEARAWIEPRIKVLQTSRKHLARFASSCKLL